MQFARRRCTSDAAALATTRGIAGASSLSATLWCEGWCFRYKSRINRLVLLWGREEMVGTSIWCGSGARASAILFPMILVWAGDLWKASEDCWGVISSRWAGRTIGINLHESGYSVQRSSAKKRATIPGAVALLTLLGRLTLISRGNPKFRLGGKEECPDGYDVFKRFRKIIRIGVLVVRKECKQCATRLNCINVTLNNFSFEWYCGVLVRSRAETYALGEQPRRALAELHKYFLAKEIYCVHSGPLLTYEGDMTE